MVRHGILQRLELLLGAGGASHQARALLLELRARDRIISQLEPQDLQRLRVISQPNIKLRTECRRLCPERAHLFYGRARLFKLSSLESGRLLALGVEHVEPLDERLLHIPMEVARGLQLLRRVLAACLPQGLLCQPSLGARRFDLALERQSFLYQLSGGHLGGDRCGLELT